VVYGQPTSSTTVSRRAILKAGAAAGALQISSPFIIGARGGTPSSSAWSSFDGVYAAIAIGEVEGARLAIEHVNKRGGVLGRPLELLIEDSANDVGTGVQKTRKLIERDNVNCIIGDVNSGIALAMAGVTSEKKVLHIVSGGHTDVINRQGLPIGTSSAVCNTTTMGVNAIATLDGEELGQEVYFPSPPTSLWHSSGSFIKRLKQAGGEYAGDLVPLAPRKYSAYLIKGEGLCAQRA